MGALSNLPPTYPRELFIECGTGQAETLRNVYQSGEFRHIISCEIDRGLYEKALKEFNGLLDVELWWGDSRNVLKKVLRPNIPTTIWLDSHYSGGYFGESRPPDECPLMDEIDIILSVDWQAKCAVLIDDLRVFNDPWWDTEEARNVKYTRANWPTEQQIREKLTSKGWTVSYHSDDVLAAVNY